SRRRHTRFSRDWSSDVCSSDLDQHGIVWPPALAPFQVALIPMNMHKSTRVQAVAEQLYTALSAAGIEVLFDDRKERPGVMFADMELIGIPHQVIIGERNLDEQLVEYKCRRTGNRDTVPIAQLVSYIQQQL